MNRTKIDWADWTWNPVTGCWGPGGTPEKPKRCWYCYAAKIAHRMAHVEGSGYGHGVESPRPEGAFNPRFHQDRLSQPARVKKPSRIFVCSMGDLFGDWVPRNWIEAVLNVAKAKHFPGPHTYIFLTKNPKRYQEFNPWPENCWLLTTCENQAAADKRIPELLKVDCRVRGVSLEPLLGAVDVKGYIWDDWKCPECGYLSGSRVTYEERCDICGSEVEAERLLHWLIVGAMTGPGSKQHQPAAEWVQSLIDQGMAAGVPVFLKDNLKWCEEIREFPKC